MGIYNRVVLSRVVLSSLKDQFQYADSHHEPQSRLHSVTTLETELNCLEYIIQSNYRILDTFPSNIHIMAMSCKTDKDCPVSTWSPAVVKTGQSGEFCPYM